MSARRGARREVVMSRFRDDGAIRRDATRTYITAIIARRDITLYSRLGSSIIFYCVPLHQTVLYCIPLRIAIHCLTLHCATLHYTALRHIALHYTALQLHFIPWR